MDHETSDDKQDIVLDLNFVPQWARKPAGVNPYVQRDEDETRGRRPPSRERRDRGPGGPRRPREGAGGRPPRDRAGQPRREGAGRPPRERAGGPPREWRGDERRRRPERQAPAPIPDIPLEISFVPERNRLGSVVKKIHSTSRAYPIMDLAALFLSSPDSYWVKLEVHEEKGEKDGHKLFQCMACKSVFLDEKSAHAHALGAHLEEVYEVEEREGDPLAGNFVCIGRCRLSGILVGPPNYHGYNEKIIELHRTKFSGMPIDQYRRQIEIVRDEELIEKWKQETRKHTVYKLRGDESGAEMDRAEAETAFLRDHAPRLIRHTAKVVLPARVTQEMRNDGLKRLVREAWTRESRFPLSLSLALRPAFRHMRLYLFKANRGATFVTAIPPYPVDPEHTVQTIREVLEHLREHPGCTRQKMVEGLCPGASPESAEVAAVLNPLRWLIEKGHVVEFFNGTLAVPTGRGRGPRRQKAHSKHSKRRSRPKGGKGKA